MVVEGGMRRVGLDGSGMCLGASEGVWVMFCEGCRGFFDFTFTV